MARKLAVIVAGIAFQDSFWALIASLFSFVVVWRLLVRWKPYATQGNQFDTRLVQGIILLLMVRPTSNEPLQSFAVFTAVTVVSLCCQCQCKKSVYWCLSLR